MLAVRTPGASQAARYSAGCDSAFPFERQGRLLRSRSISGLCSRSLSFRPTTSLSTLRNGRYRTPRKTRFAAACEALPRPSSPTADFNAAARRKPHRSRRARLTHEAPPSGAGVEAVIKLTHYPIPSSGNNLPVFGNVLSAPEAIRGMIDAMLHILAKDPGE